MASLTVTYQVNQQSDHCFSLKISASAPVGLPDDHVFMIQVMPLNPDPSQPTSRFSHVVDYEDMDTYPTQYTREQAYYRENAIQLLLSSRFQVTQVLQAIKEQIHQLVTAAQVITNENLPMQTSQTIVIQS